MKEKKIERTVYDIKWEAIDGTLFLSKEECETYEKTARMVLWDTLKRLTLLESNEWNLLGAGYSDVVVHAIKMVNPEDGDKIKQLLLLDNLWATKEGESTEKWRTHRFEQIDKALEDADVLLVFEDCESNICDMMARQTIIDKLENLDKEEPEDAK